jgi:hypothetical protein
LRHFSNPYTSRYYVAVVTVISVVVVVVIVAVAVAVAVAEAVAIGPMKRFLVMVNGTYNL